MTVEEISFSLELAGQSREQQIKLLSSTKKADFDVKTVYKKLLFMGPNPNQVLLFILASYSIELLSVSHHLKKIKTDKTKDEEGTRLFHFK